MANLQEVECFLDHVCDTYNINNYAATISMSLLQAVENAIVHGNGCDVQKNVTVTADTCRGGIEFIVEDQGEGFEYQQFGALPQQGRGEGLFVMKSLSDQLTFENGGSRVRMRFVISGIEPSKALERIVILNNFYARHHAMA
ncbi:MAG: ATP-binding protein [Bacteroidales bacterium]|nr:ATP-binding protein [Bacteroidales bacterium]